MASGLGIEPRISPPKGDVLPLHHPEMYCNVKGLIPADTYIIFYLSADGKFVSSAAGASSSDLGDTPLGFFANSS